MKTFKKDKLTVEIYENRTLRATSRATPRFFNFLSIFVSGQTCGQATYFEHFLENCTARIVSVVKGFRGSNKSTKESPCGCPERDALPTALRLDFYIFSVSVSGQIYDLVVKDKNIIKIQMSIASTRLFVCNII